MYQVKFIEDTKMLPKDVSTVELGKLSGSQWQTDLLVFQADKAILHLVCFGDDLEYRFKQEALIWFDWLIVGFGHRIYLYELKKRLSKVVDLGAYFCKLHPTTNCLFATSGEYIHAFDKTGEILWASELLGIDGVVIHEINEGFLLGEGEFEPPNGWRPFKITLTTGQVEWL